MLNVICHGRHGMSWNVINCHGTESFPAGSSTSAHVYCIIKYKLFLIQSNYHSNSKDFYTPRTRQTIRASVKNRLCGNLNNYYVFYPI